MNKPASHKKPRGAVLDPDRAQRHLDLRHLPPHPDLAPFVRHHWFIDWSVQEPFVQGVLGLPAGNLVVDGASLQVSGPFTERFDRVVSGTASVYGTMLHPAGLRAFGFVPKEMVDDRFDIAGDWAIDARALNEGLKAAANDAHRVNQLTELLIARSPAATKAMHQANKVVRAIESDPTLTRTEQVAKAFGISVRALQRLLQAEVGLSAKALVRRYRLQEASARLSEGQSVDLADIAFSLGYADQAHFSRDFRVILGEPPSVYAARQPRRRPRTMQPVAAAVPERGCRCGGSDEDEAVR